jgi:ketopantoate hydroxymethyltransferase
MTSTTPKKVRVPDLALMKQRGDRIVMLTAYDATMARLLDRAGIDLLLVGDSLGNVIMGLDTTIPVTLDVMIHHTRAVARGANRALVVADMPFLTYQVSPEQAMRNATRLFQEGGAAAVKLEGGRAVADTVRKLTAAGLPVMGHLGLTPQQGDVSKLGTFSITKTLQLDCSTTSMKNCHIALLGSLARFPVRFEKPWQGGPPMTTSAFVRIPPALIISAMSSARTWAPKFSS